MENKNTSVGINCTSQAAPQSNSSSLGLTGMILSLVSLGLWFFTGIFISPFLAIAALIVSIIGKVKFKKDSQSTVGIIISAITLVLNAVSLIFIILLVALFLILAFLPAIIASGIIMM